jgi:hypothetical protein
MNNAAIVMNPGGRKSGSATPFSVSDAIGMETDKLMELAAGDNFRKWNQGALKALVWFEIVCNIVH